MKNECLSGEEYVLLDLLAKRKEKGNWAHLIDKEFNFKLSVVTDHIIGFKCYLCNKKFIYTNLSGELINLKCAKHGRHHIRKSNLMPFT